MVVTGVDTVLLKKSHRGQECGSFIPVSERMRLADVACVICSKIEQVQPLWSVQVRIFGSIYGGL